jgi:hypothetical protein
MRQSMNDESPEASAIGCARCFWIYREHQPSRVASNLRSTGHIIIERQTIIAQSAITSIERWVPDHSVRSG